MALQTKTISANGSKGHHKFTLTVTENSTSTANNTSYVSWSFVLSPVVKNYDWNYSSTVPVTYSVVFNGTTYSGNIMSYDGTSTVTVKSGSATITHNADGNKSISYSFSVSSISASYLPGSASANGSMALTYIPRAATITSAPNFTDEDNPTITFSNPAGNSVTSLKACISLTGATDDIAYQEIKDKTGTSFKFTLTDSERNVLRNATTGSDSRTVYFYLWTVIGGNDYRVNVQRTFSVINADPVVTGTVTDENDTTYALTNNRSKLIKYYSNATATISATPQKGASINESKYVIRNGSNTWDGKTHTFNNAESNVFTFYAEDSRGNSTTYTLTPAPTMVNYIKLTCDISNNRPDALGNMTVACSGNYFNGSFGAASNTLAVQYRYKLSTDSWLNTEDEWHDMAITKSGNKYFATADFVIPNFGQQKIYSFQTRAIDKLSTVPSKEQSVQSMPIFHWGENDFVFEVPTTFNGDVTVDGLSGMVKASSGKLSAATSGTDYATPAQVNAKQNKITASGILKGNGSGTISAAVAGTDYATPTTNLLWSGVKLMNPNTDQNITLSQAVSKQNKGIVLVFSEYNPSTNTVGNSMVSSHFVSKYEVSALSGVGHLFTTFATWGKAMAKYLYITDTTIRGHDANDNAGTATNGLLYDNTCFVLRYVIGV